MKARVGRFCVAEALLCEKACDIFALGKFAPYSVELIKQVYHYAAYSPLFDEIEEGEIIPQYTINIRVERGILTSVWVTREKTDLQARAQVTQIRNEDSGAMRATPSHPNVAS